LRFDNSYNEILGKEFSFALKLKDDPKTVPAVSLGTLKVPANFDLKDFLAKNIDKEKWIIL